MKNDTSTPFSSLSPELRRGVIVLAILSQLKEERYGYSLKEHLAAQGLRVQQGTLYPLLRRLESQGLLTSRWQVDSGRPRRYYQISLVGEFVLKETMTEWKRLSQVVGRLLPND